MHSFVGFPHEMSLNRSSPAASGIFRARMRLDIVSDVEIKFSIPY